MRVEVDRGRCCGSGYCALAVPEVFDQDDVDGLVILRVPEPHEYLADKIRYAIDHCPGDAIRLSL